MTVKIEGYLTAEPCRDLNQAKPGQLAIEGNAGREYREVIVEISKVYATGQITLTGGAKYNAKWGSEFRRVGKNPAGMYGYSLRPFKEGETVESFLAAIQAREDAQAAELQTKQDAKEAEHKRRLALLGGASLWEGRDKVTYSVPGCADAIDMSAMAWIDSAGKLHVTHACVRKTDFDWDQLPVDYLEIWDVDREEAGKTSIRTNNVRDAVERYITAEYA